MFKVEIDTDNDAFADGQEQELSRILRYLADEVEAGNLERILRDSNGNRVGLSSVE